jgi:hypothetical protein
MTSPRMHPAEVVVQHVTGTPGGLSGSHYLPETSPTFLRIMIEETLNMLLVASRHPELANPEMISRIGKALKAVIMVSPEIDESTREVLREKFASEGSPYFMTSIRQILQSCKSTLYNPANPRIRRRDTDDVAELTHNFSRLR